MTQPSHPITLTILRPVSVAPVEPDRPSSPVALTPAITANILLVDDDPRSLMAMETILAGPGRKIVKAESGEDALRHLLQQDFALILLDVRMPRLDGFETAALIRQRARSRYTPIIFLSAADTMDADVFRGYSVGAVDYLFKPFIPEILKAKVTVFVDLFQIRDRVRQQAEQLNAINQKLDQDITARKRAEETRAHLAAIVESSDDAIISKTLDGVVTSWNKGAERIYGYSADEIVGRPSSILLPAHIDEEPQILERLKRGERIQHSEPIRRRKDGQDIDVSLTISPIKDASGKIIGGSMIVRDITERKLAEEEIKKSSAQLEAAYKE